MKYRGFSVATISARVMLVFSTVIILLASTMLLINAWSKETLRKELSQAMTSQNRYFMHILDRDLRQIRQRQKELSGGEPLRRLVYLPSFLSAREIQYNAQWLSREMAVLRDVSPLVQDARIYVQDKENPIFTTYVSLFTLVESLGERFDGGDGMAEAYRSMEGQYHFTLSYPIHHPLEWADFLLDVVLSNEAIQATLNQLYMGQDGLVLLTNGKMDWYVGNAMSEGIGLTPQPQWLRAETGSQVIHLQGETYFLYQERFDDYDLVLFTLYPEHSAMGGIAVYHTWYWSIIALSGIVLILAGLYLHRRIHQPLQALLGAFADVAKGDLYVHLHYSGSDEFSYLYRSFNSTIEQLRRSIDETYAYKLHAREAEIKQLQSQINPHFLYNCFFVLYNMAELEDMDSIMQMTQYLGQYYQYVFKSDTKTVKLEEELEQAMHYLRIQNLRFGDRLQVCCDTIPMDFRQVLIPKLIFQPLIENIFAHGLRESFGKIRIRFIEEEKRLRICIDDNGVGMAPHLLEALQKSLDEESVDAEHTSALHNINRRLKLHFGQKSGLRMSLSALGGLSIQFCIPQAEGNALR